MLVYIYIYLYIIATTIIFIIATVSARTANYPPRVLHIARTVGGIHTHTHTRAYQNSGDGIRAFVTASEEALPVVPNTTFL